MREAASLGGAHATLVVTGRASSSPSPSLRGLLSRCFGGQNRSPRPPMRPQFGALGIPQAPKAYQVLLALPPPQLLSPACGPQQKLTPADAIQSVLRTTVCMSSVVKHNVEAAPLARAAERLCALYPPLAGRMVKHIPG